MERRSRTSSGLGSFSSSGGFGASEVRRRLAETASRSLRSRSSSDAPSAGAMSAQNSGSAGSRGLAAEASPSYEAEALSPFSGSSPFASPAATPSGGRGGSDARRRMRDLGTALVSSGRARSAAFAAAVTPSLSSSTAASSSSAALAPSASRGTVAPSANGAVGRRPSGSGASAPARPHTSGSTSSAHLVLGPPESPSAQPQTQQSRRSERQEAPSEELVAASAQAERLQRQIEALQRAGSALRAAMAQAEAAAGAPGFPPGEAGDNTLVSSSEDGDPADAENDDDEDEDEEQVHFNVSCDGCGARPPLRGNVWRCSECADFDLCARCYAERGSLGHPPWHRFMQHAPPRRGLTDALMYLLDYEMMREAMLLSTNGGVAVEEEEDPQIRAAELLSKLSRIRWNPEKHCGAGGPGSEECEECSLCLEELIEGEELLQLGCSHVFHEGCLGPWLARPAEPLCPLCKRAVS